MNSGEGTPLINHRGDGDSVIDSNLSRVYGNSNPTEMRGKSMTHLHSNYILIDKGQWSLGVNNIITII